MPNNPAPALSTFYNYYKTSRGYHERSINSTTAWTATTLYSFFAFDLNNHLELLNNKQIFLIAGENAHSRYHSETIAELILHNTELTIIPEADHCDLYNKKNLIPFDKIEAFFNNM
ncbi:hypothetical protein [Staphylococcus kloosii]|uniref:hypothetical protein n=1 Tax=Staphylococcus kloosii TaxID=29384 RepID=UPI0028A4897D|nr:hypothetical protein [Staphylococcus kloosii]MDT3959880.1 hypothetical protein [Staphylococcus kloosii]